MHGVCLGGTAVAITHSIPAGLAALVPGLQPILTSTLANRWLGERVTPLQWSGLLLGLALSYAGGYLHSGASLVPLVALGILVLVLMVRPDGLFSATQVRRV